MRIASLLAVLLLPAAVSAQQVVVGKASTGSTVALFSAASFVSSFEPFPAFPGGARVAVGDVNGDGYPDTIVGAGPGGGTLVTVRSGLDGSTIDSFFAFDPASPVGVSVAAADFNGDGRADIVVGADSGGISQVIVFSGTGHTTMLGAFVAFAPGFTGGVRVAAGDVNGDGTPDVICAAGPGGGPLVRVLSGTDYSTELTSFFAYASSFTGGVYVAAGDVDGDGHADIITGPGAGGGPEVKVVSGATGATVRDFFAYIPSFVGGVTVGAGWIDGDTKDDIVVGSATQSGRVTAFRGTDLATLQDFFAFLSFTGGVFVAGTAPSPEAYVSGDATICGGHSTTITADLAGSAPWNIVWSDGVSQHGITASPATRLVSPAATTTYTLTRVSDLHGTGQSTGSAVVTVVPDATPPTVVAPAAIVVDQTLCCGVFGGASGATNGTVAAFLAGGSATDDCDPAPARQTPQAGGLEVTATTCFESGTTAVTFAYKDAAGHTGTKDSNVFVRMYGDLNLDSVIDPSDMVVMRAFLNFAIAPRTPPFNAPVEIADLTHDLVVDPSDLVLLRAYFNFAVSCLSA